ncbi:MAG TPA: 50S ribosomal protein L11 methyltransferase [Candidatus Competibacteraceae bacterium]|nr:50S ribosomal protein L11 methyltransferase [Candidatus Competibacteraceae bacterium]
MSTETTLWLQLTLESPQHSPEQLENALLQAGALAITLQDATDQPVLEPLPGETPLWSRLRVTGLFDTQTDPHTVKAALRQILGDKNFPNCQVESLEERDWVRAWLDDFKPMRFGRRLWVFPTDGAAPPAEGTIIWLDPGLAFGTGTHPTTALCLEWLDGADLDGKTVIDYGCGSGILAIAAAKLGASRVWAVDIDPQALLATEANAVRNQVREILVLGNPAALPTTPVDILLANILAGPLIKLAPRFSTLVCPQGHLVLSGILVEQVEQVQAAYTQWFDFGMARRREEWDLLDAVCRGGATQLNRLLSSSGQPPIRSGAAGLSESGADNRGDNND